MDYESGMSNIDGIPGHEPDWALIGIKIGICIAGVLGNLTVMFIILVLKEYKKSRTHWYILQLAMADMMFLLTLPSKMNEDYHNTWTYSDALCKANETVLFLNYYASIMFLTIISVDRYVFICHRSNATLMKLRSNRSSLLVTIFTWLVALILCIPIVMYSGKYGFEPSCKCSYRFPKHVKTLEEHCRDEGFVTEDEIQFCTSFLPPPIEESCASLKMIKDTLNETRSHPDYNPGLFDKIIADYYSSDLKFLMGNTTLDYGAYEYITEKEDENQKSEETLSAECHYWDQGKAWSGFLLFNFVFMFLVPVAIMTFCYAMIVARPENGDSEMAISAQRTQVTSPSSGNELESGKGAIKVNPIKLKIRTSSERRRISIMCCLLVALFVICWLPFHTVHLAKIKGMSLLASNKGWCSKLPRIASIIAFANSALNPYFYNFFGVMFLYRMRSAVKTAASVVTGRK